jgi:hypothetical protein
MLKKLSLKNILITLALILLLSQFFRIDKTNPTLQAEQDITAVMKVPIELASILKASCYDCHSNEVNYPWYTNVAPLSWWIKNHINEGREELNFSEWGTYTSRRKDKKLKECAEMIEANEMPLSSYTLIHTETKLSQEQKAQLIAWFNFNRTYESDTPKED